MQDSLTINIVVKEQQITFLLRNSLQQRSSQICVNGYNRDVQKSLLIHLELDY